MNARLADWLLAVLLMAFAAGLAFAVLALPESAGGLAPAVDAQLSASGVENPVTAVLLNFRGYDTLLEVAVLSMSVIGIWSIAEMPRRRVGAPGLVLAFLVQVLVPFMILLGAYLLWAGAHQPGGAFQAGAVFAAAILLLLLSGLPLPAGSGRWPLRFLLMLGVMIFAGAGLSTILLEGRFLEFPTPGASRMILLIESAAAISIGVILAAVFRGGRPPPGSGP